MKIIKSFNILNKEINSIKNIGFVPTMGSLHDGHLSLIKKAKNKSSKILVSIFVNPAQFNDKKDFSKYPRDLKKDISILKKTKIDYLFLPSNKEIYKKGIQKKIKISKKENEKSLEKKVLKIEHKLYQHLLCFYESDTASNYQVLERIKT